jgi:predicted RecB family nuclease
VFCWTVTLPASPICWSALRGESRLGRYFYRPADIKLAAVATDGHRLQVMAYMALLEAIQGVRPEGKLLLRLPP